MNDKKSIPLSSIQQTLAGKGEHWYAADYYIARDETLTGGMTPFRPDYYSLFICIAGWLKGKVNYNTIELVPYCLTAASPGTQVELTEVSPNCKGRYLFFTRDFLLANHISPSLLGAFHYLSEQVGFSIRLTEKEAAILLQLYEILLEKRTEDNSVYHAEIVRTLFFTFLYEAAALYKKNAGDIPHSISRYKDLHHQFSELLVKHDKQEHHLKFYADALFITPKYLIHAIRNACGKTPGTLIDEAIVAEAKLLLRDGNLLIADIAAALRFSDQAAFSKFFKKHTGESPSTFRNQL
ncbi:helix-turn-helix transcriptional regulator [Mucilaginibacter sp. SMC90]|uniref:AraC family transcriptional regulator n=1 Tax=Mucilaginibacter sp. SMC90 TaxID=2929803 RepID=UPI0027388AD7|nr:helix-turn-helix transcriptional regulator [Mucilaginibacter sp. SMC90]